MAAPPNWVPPSRCKERQRCCVNSKQAAAKAISHRVFLLFYSNQCNLTSKVLNIDKVYFMQCCLPLCFATSTLSESCVPHIAALQFCTHTPFSHVHIQTYKHTPTLQILNPKLKCSTICVQFILNWNCTQSCSKLFSASNFSSNTCASDFQHLLLLAQFCQLHSCANIVLH